MKNSWNRAASTKKNVKEPSSNHLALSQPTDTPNSSLCHWASVVICSTDDRGYSRLSQYYPVALRARGTLSLVWCYKSALHYVSTVFMTSISSIPTFWVAAVCTIHHFHFPKF